MQRKDCFGSIKEIALENGMTMTRTRPECRDCADFRDCLFHVKLKDEEKKQSLISQIIDHSEVHSNEIGSCLLDFLNRMYSHPVGTALFKNLVLFHEVSQNDSSLTVTVPLSRSLLEAILGQHNDSTQPLRPVDIEQGLMVRIILLQRRFPNNRKANTGLIAHEVASLLSSNDSGTKQIMQVLSEPEAKAFGKMDRRLKINWLIEQWGLREEHESFRNEVNRLGTDMNKWEF